MRRRGLVGLVLLAGCATPATPSALEESFATAFSGRYVVQQAQDGRRVDARSLQAQAVCGRTGQDEDGPGDDWACQVTYSDATPGSTTPLTQAFEVQVRGDGCWRAEAPATSQPARREDPRSGALLVNPLAELDGCLDTSW